MPSAHPPILQGAPVDPGAHKRQRASGALSPDFMQGAAVLMAEHPAAKFFGLAGNPVPRHHRGAGPGVSPGMWTPAGGSFLARACAVQWEAPGRVAVNVPHWPVASSPAHAPHGEPRTGADGEPLGGSWVPAQDPYTERGQCRTAMVEDDDRAPAPRPRSPHGWPVGLAGVALLVLVLAACFMTGDGGF